LTTEISNSPALTHLLPTDRNRLNANSSAQEHL